MVVHLVTFASKEYIHSSILLRHSALQNGVDKVYIYNEDDIEEHIQTHPDIYKFKKGFGCYSWQPYILLNKFNQIKNDDIIIYCDSGIIINNNISPLLELCKKYGSAFFNVGEFREKDYKNKYWTKKNVFHKMNCTQTKYYNAFQVMGGLQLYVKNKENFKFITELSKYCNDYEIITDIEIPEYVNDINFKEHRHNQSVLTNLVVKYNRKIFRDPSQDGKKDIVDESNYNVLIYIHRQKINKILKVVIITPTIGDYRLDRCIQSVQNQTYQNIEHVIVIDGPQFGDKVNKIVNKYKNKNELTVYQLAKNTGRNRWNGHRIYGSFPYLCDSDYICYLDEDNWFDNNHIKSLINLIYIGKFDWGFTLRKIVSKTGEFICNDNCESLGNLNHIFHNEKEHLIDTSCYMLKRDISIRLAYCWNSKFRQPNKMEADRLLYHELNKMYPNYNCTQQYTLNYSVDNKEYSINGNYFLHGNNFTKDKYGCIPWINNKMKLYIAHFNSNATHKYMTIAKYKRPKSYAYDEWQMTLLDVVNENYNLNNAYTEPIPQNSIVLMNICNIDELPLKVLKRTDIIKIGYTLEGPNIRHQTQWKCQFLNYFDYILTYWEPLLHKFTSAIYCPFIHRINFNNILDKQFLDNPTIMDKSICFVGENRDFLNGTYEINKHKLLCLDRLRLYYIKNLKNVTCYGKGWDNVKNIKLGKTEWDRDRGHNINIIKNYTFNLIIENTNADGYVSEKIYDSFTVGTIPIYYGNINHRINIPKDTYIDLKCYTPQTLQEYINNLSINDIHNFKKNILEKRENILRQVSPEVYCNSVKTIIDNIQKLPIIE